MPVVHGVLKWSIAASIAVQNRLKNKLSRQINRTDAE